MIILWGIAACANNDIQSHAAPQGGPILCGNIVCPNTHTCTFAGCMERNPCANVDCKPRGETYVCYQGQCVDGAQRIDNDHDGADVSTDCDDGDEQRYPNNPEICDGKDNDCDYYLDEDTADGSACTIEGRTDVCTAVRVCKGAQGIACEVTKLKSAEVCDGDDNDCDGQIDNIPAPECIATDASRSTCAVGAFACVNNAPMCKAGATSGTETCNNIDDDRDGFIDEGTTATGCVLSLSGKYGNVPTACVKGECTLPLDGCETPVNFRGHVYSYCKTTPLNQNDAKTKCQNWGGYLVVLDNAEEENFVRSLSGCGTAPTPTMWIGLSRTGTPTMGDKSAFTWASATEPSAYNSNWCDGNPSGDGNCVTLEKCTINGNQTYAGWNDRDCLQTTQTFVCELEKTNRIMTVQH